MTTRNALARILAAAWVLAAGLAQAHEADWLYFPMYERDTAHAVDLRALKFGADGLLASGSRYPRTSSEAWTPEQSQQGWYEYETRVIDCETGLWVSTKESLLDREGRVIASKPIDREQQLKSLGDKLRSDTPNWPRGGTEIFLACAAASSPELKARRERVARMPVPLISHEPLTRGLMQDTDTLRERASRTIDVAPIARKRPPTAAALFEQLRAQYQVWRLGFDRSYRQPAPPDAARRAQIERRAAERYESMGGRPGTLRLRGASVIDYEREWDAPWGTQPPRQAARAVRVTESVRMDCESGVFVPLARVWRDEAGAALLTTPVPPAEALEAASRSDEGVTVWGPLDVPQGTRAVQVCRLVAEAAQESSSAPHHEESDDQARTTYGLAPEALAQHATPQAMLLAVRQAVRARRAQFNYVYTASRP